MKLWINHNFLLHLNWETMVTRLGTSQDLKPWFEGDLRSCPEHDNDSVLVQMKWKNTVNNWRLPSLTTILWEWRKGLHVQTQASFIFWFIWLRYDCLNEVLSPLSFSQWTCCCLLPFAFSLSYCSSFNTKVSKVFMGTNVALATADQMLWVISLNYKKQATYTAAMMSKRRFWTSTSYENQSIEGIREEYLSFYLLNVNGR